MYFQTLRSRFLSDVFDAIVAVTAQTPLCQRHPVW